MITSENLSPEKSHYKLRGHRVAARGDWHVQAVAESFCQIFKLDSNTGTSFESLLDYLSVEKLIHIDVVDTDEWDIFFRFANGHYDPNALSIRVPNTVWENFYSEYEAEKQEAVHTFFHELGHFALGHAFLMHDSNEPPSRHEDAESQADVFADYILVKLGLLPRQMDLGF